MIQPVTRKTVTVEAVPDFTLHHLLAVLDSACDAGFGFDTVVPSATGACLLISCICATEATIHSTGSDQSYVNRIFLFRFNFRHICISANVLLIFWGHNAIYYYNILYI